MAKLTPDQERLKKLRALKPGMSVFVKDGTQNSTQGLRKLAYDAGIPISIYVVANDSVHKCAGARIFKEKHK